MLVAIGYCTKDQDQAQRLASWMAELGPYPNHRLLVARDARAKGNVFSAAGFASVEEIVITDDAWDSWPQSCNNVFRKVGKHVEFGTKEPFLWIEADVAPMREGWIDAIAAEYATCGKPFMGDRVEVEGVPLHMSGVAIYPGILSARAGLCYLAQEMAWDVIAADQIVPQAHFTKLIEHAWKHPTFENWEQVEREIAPETVLYHASKDGSLIRLLRERKNLPVLVPAESPEGARNPALVDLQAVRPESDEARESTKAVMRKAEPDSRGGQFICDIFIKTYPPDYPWLKYCLRSVEKFATGFDRIILAAPDDRDALLAHVRPGQYRHWQVAEQADGYLGQQVAKLHADEHTDATHILFTDSDTIFTRPVTPDTYFTEGLVNWMITPYAKTDTPWKPMIEKFLRRPVEFETMRRHPQMVPRWLLVAMRKFCEQQHGMTLDKYIMSQPYREFSEFNALGAFAYYFHNDRVNWINTEEVPAEQWPPLTVLQKYSHGGLTPEIEAEFDAILGDTPATCANTDCPCVAASTEAHANGAPLLATLPQQVPWESKEQSLEEIRTLAKALKNFGDNAAHVRAVRLELHKLGVIQLPYRFRKRKGKWKKRTKKA